MAGFFGLFNYAKEGPGVSKNEPKKKGFFRFFEIYGRNFWKLVTLNLFNDLLCIPVLTYGLAEIGLANVTRNISREKHSFGTSDFFDTIKKNWKQGLLTGIINLVLTALLIFDVIYFFPREGDSFVSSILSGVSLFLLFTFTVMKYYIPMLIITFSLRTGQLYKNAFRFVFLNFKRNLLIVLVLTLCLAAILLISIYGGAIGAALMTIVFVAVYPSFRSFLIQFNIFDCIRKFMIDPYYEEHPDADIEKRLALGLTVPEEYMPKYDDDVVFEDERILPENE